MYSSGSGLGILFAIRISNAPHESAADFRNAEAVLSSRSIDVPRELMIFHFHVRMHNKPDH